MPLDLDDVELFVRAAAAGGLSEAARQLGLTPQIASRRLARLEAALDTRLMHRTTRRVALTSDGDAFLPAAERLLAEAEAAEASVGRNRQAPRGLLRVTAPATFGRKLIAPLLPDLLARHPALRIDLQLTDGVVDLVETGMDVAIRIASPADSSLVGRKLADNPLLLVAAPAYLAARGQPRLLDDLLGHDCLVRSGSWAWAFGTPRGERQVRVRGPVASNSNEALREAALAGLGIGLHSLWDIHDHLAAGALRPIVLADGAPQSLAVWALRPGGRGGAAPRVQAFVEILSARMAAVAARAGPGATDGGRGPA